MQLPGPLKRACDALPRGIGGVAPDDDVAAAVRSMLISAVQATRSTLSTLRDLIDGILFVDPKRRMGDLFRVCSWLKKGYKTVKGFLTL